MRTHQLVRRLSLLRGRHHQCAADLARHVGAQVDGRELLDLCGGGWGGCGVGLGC